MYYYFKLQGLRLQRWCEDFGLPWPVVMVLVLGLFLLGSVALFIKVEQAGWVYLLLAYSMLSYGDLPKQNQRLKLLFITSDYYRIKLIETGLKAMPFVLFSFYKEEIFVGTALIVLVFLRVFWSSRTMTIPILPTPFKRWAYEFVIGCRKYFLLILLLWFVVLKSVQVDNANLGLVCLGFLSMLSASFYLPIEPIRIVWQHILKPKEFLKIKLGFAVLCQTCFLAPVVVLLLIFFPTYYWATAVLTVIGLLMVITAILAKYSKYPKDIGVLQAFIMGFSFVLPFFLPVALWIFWKQAKQKLQTIL